MPFGCIEDYHSSRYELIKKNFLASRDTFSAESIHDMRVEIKRLRAFYRFVGRLNRSFQAKPHFREIRQLFKAAGGLRDIQVQKELFLEIYRAHGLGRPDCLEYFDQKETAAAGSYAAVAGQFDIEKIAENYRFIADSIKDLDGRDIRRKLYQGINKLLRKLHRKKSRGDLSADDLHRIRINTKAARYNLELLIRCFDHDKNPESLNKHLRQVHRALGKWHDFVIATTTLEILKDRMAPETLSALRKIFTSNRENYLEQFASAYDTLSDFLQKNPIEG